LYDVVIAGAGVAGNYAAYRLAALGYSTAVVEEHAKVGESVQCTGIIGAECFQRFPVFDGTVLREVRSARLFSPSRREMRLHRDSPQAYVVDRAAFDQELAQKAQERGAEYLLGHKIIDVAVGDDAVTVTTEGQETFRARTAVIATGCTSTLPARLGMGRIGDIIMGAQVEVDINDVRELEVDLDQDLAPGFFAWLVPTSQQKALVGLLARQNSAQHLRDFVDMLLRQGKIAPPQATPTYGGIPLHPPRRTHTQRVLVVGDAAGHVKPTTGGGVYYGLLCAEIAAGVLAQALSANDFSPRLFSEYQQKWQERLGRELRIDRFARQVYERLSNRQIEAVFGIINSNGIHEAMLRSPELSFDWHGDAIVKGLKHLGPWRHLLAIGGKE
jgi:digeranylgeranylglycerophospholipid reductase